MEAAVQELADRLETLRTNLSHLCTRADAVKDSLDEILERRANHTNRK